MEDTYEAIKTELFAKRNQLIELPIRAIPPKILGDYSETLLRDLIYKYIDKTVYEAKSGLIYDEKGEISTECDIIIYEKGKTPLFETKNLVIVNQKYVKFVFEIKSTLNSKNLTKTIKNFKTVKNSINK